MADDNKKLSEGSHCHGHNLSEEEEVKEMSAEEMQ
jgi:hypothetical protein